MAESNHNSGDHNGDSRVPMAVLDRFLSLSKENNEAYGAMVAALDQMSTKVMDTGDRVEALERTIIDEQLGTVLMQSVADIKTQVQDMKALVGVLAVPKYNLMKSIGEYMEFTRANEDQMKSLAEDIVFTLRFVNFFRRNRVVFAFMLGIILVGILKSVGYTAWDVIKFIVAKV